jgi:hypothetical protein
MRASFALVILLSIGVRCIMAQQSDGYGINLPKFYRQKLHFGFSISGTQTDFVLVPKSNSTFKDTVINAQTYQINTILPVNGTGFALGFVGDARLAEYLRMRFCPGVSYAFRKIEYRLNTLNLDSLKIFEKSVESFFVILPIEFKIQSKRQANFSAYVIGGGGTAIDLYALKKSGTAGGPNQVAENIKLFPNDVYYSAGAGTDFYLNYFKLGLEIKLLTGVKNLLKPSSNIFSQSLNTIKNQMLVFSITFEG